MFTTDNSEGLYSAAQLEALNARVRQLMAEGWDEKNAMVQAEREFDNASD